MKRLVIAVAVILLAAVSWAGATYLVGGQVEKRYLALFERYGQWGPIQWTSEEYQRGFLTSKARSMVEFKAPAPARDGEEQQLRLTFEHVLHHGPLPTTTPDGQLHLAPMLTMVETRLVQVSANNQEIEDVLGELPQLNESYAFTLIGLTGGGSSRLMVPAIEKSDPEKTFAVQWGGMNCDMQFSRAMKDLSGDFVMSLVQIRMKDGDLHWDGASGSFDVSEAFPMVYVGNSEMHFGTMRMAFVEPAGSNQKEVLLKGLNVSSQSSREENVVHYSQTVNLEELTVDGKTFGPGQVEVATLNFDGEALSRFQIDIQEMYRDGSFFNPDEMTIRMLPIYTRLVEELIPGSPEIQFRRIQFATPMGRIDGTVRVKIDGQGDLVLNNPQSWLKNLEAEADLNVDETLVQAVFSSDVESKLQAARERGDFPAFSDEEISDMAKQQIEGQLESLAAQNFLLRGDGKITSHADFNRGELMVNGRPVPLN